MKQILYSIILTMMCTAMFAQNGNQKDYDWPAECDIRFRSTADGTMQPAYFLRAKSSEPRPLVVRLHAWSAHYTNYQMDDSYVQQCIDADFNYLQPEFRGPNERPEACGSPLVVADIDDAIDYAITHGNVDTTQIHIIGSSGGGHATMLCYMRLKHNIKTFTAMSSISDIVDYYYQCAGRREKYGNYMTMVERATSGWPREGFTPYFNKEEAIKRSPVYMDTPVEQRKNSKLFIIHGIHDGCLHGDVPFTHSTKFFNKVVADYDYPASVKLKFTAEEVLQMMDWQTVDNPAEKKHNQVLVQRQYEDKVQIRILENGHGHDEARTLDGARSQNIVLLGDNCCKIVNKVKSDCFDEFIYNIKGINVFNVEEALLAQKLVEATTTLQGMHRLIITLATPELTSAAAVNSGIKSLETFMKQLQANEIFVKYNPLVDIVLLPAANANTPKLQAAFTKKMEAAIKNSDAKLTNLSQVLSNEGSNGYKPSCSAKNGVIADALKNIIRERKIKK